MTPAVRQPGRFLCGTDWTNSNILPKYFPREVVARRERTNKELFHVRFYRIRDETVAVKVLVDISNSYCTVIMDLNVIIENCGPRDSDQTIKQKLARCKALGFDTIALSVIIEVKDDKFSVPPPPDVKGISQTQHFKIYTRLTVKVSETIQLYKLSKVKEAAKYDLLALEPQNAKILQYISSGSADLDILTFDITQRLEYTLLKTPFRVLEDRGVCVEINYGPAQLGSSLRRNTICNGQNLVEKTSKNIILSSGISDCFRLRGPIDATSVGLLFLMTTNKCHNAVFKNGQKAINQAKHRANPASSAIELVQ